jgi:hypothetical protein
LYREVHFFFFFFFFFFSAIANQLILFLFFPTVGLLRDPRRGRAAEELPAYS